MKYIRTKDGIYIQCKLNGYENCCCLKGNMNITKLSDLDIIKQADTIEELCDEFVAIYKDENKSARVLETFGDYRQLDEKQLIYNIKNGWNIYGAIWTDKGLQFVARMNSEGALELL